MSTTDDFHQSDDPSRALAPLDGAPEFVWIPAPARRKFQHRYGVHLLLFALTLLTTSYHDAFAWMWMHPAGANPFALFTPAVFVSGLSYSIPLLVILGAHEFGHYFACRYYNVDATLPFFIPAPLPITGTLGAVIRIREMFPSRRAIFDIGIAGPIAGFVMLLPFLVVGIYLSNVQPVPADAISFGDPLLFKLISRLHFGAMPAGWDVVLHPIGFAAWWGMLATALNLLPFGQLDGGHVMYATVGRRAAWLSGATLFAVVLLTTRSTSWITMAVLLAAMALFLGFRHPRPLDEHQPLGRGRWLVAAGALAMFVLCFTPAPIDVGGGAPPPPPARRGRKIEVQIDTPAFAPGCTDTHVMPGDRDAAVSCL